MSAPSPALPTSSISAGDWVRLTVGGNEDADLRADVAAAVAAKGYQLRELRRETGSLEDFFVQITYEQSMRAADASVPAVAAP